ncbi:11077_t:CDS:2, partial [Dentiscutata heterogama]
MAKILKCPGCDREIRTSKTRNLNKHMNLNRNLRKGQCQPALLIMQNVENVTPEQNIPQTKNVTPEEANAPAVDPLTDDVLNTEAGSNNKKDSEPSDSEYVVFSE